MNSLLKYILVFLAALSVSTGFAKKYDMTFVQIHLMNNQLEIEVPSDFTQMKESEFKALYNTEMMPKLVLSNADKSVRIAFETISLGKDQDDTGVLKSGAESMIRNRYPKSKFKQEGISTIDARQVGHFETLIKQPVKAYKFIFFTNFKGQTLICTLDAPKKGYKQWRYAGNYMMNSLDIDEN